VKLTDFATLAEARAYEHVQEQMINRNQMNGILAQAVLYVSLKAIAASDGHPFQDAMAAFFDATEYNFTAGTPVGDQNIAMLDAMIAAGLPESPALAATRPTVVALANPMVKPYEYTTLHQFLTANGTCPRKPVAPSNGWLQITLAAAVETHSPSVWNYVSEFDHWERIGGFAQVGGAGAYTLKVSKAWSQLWIDDAYGVL